jgi:hypothetical protein
MESVNSIGRRILLNWSVMMWTNQHRPRYSISKVCFLLTSLDSDPNFFLEKIIGSLGFFRALGDAGPTKRAGLAIVSAFQPIGRYL